VTDRIVSNMSDNLAVGDAAEPAASASPLTETPAASALPLTGQPSRELVEIDTELVSRKALAAGSSLCVTDRIVSNMSDNLAVGDATEPAASASPLTGVTDRIVAMIGELSQ
ncbi:MAG: hypothetical protein WD049_04220, partial [Candidatus Paceibacterota bacterium]